MGFACALRRCAHPRLIPFAASPLDAREIRRRRDIHGRLLELLEVLETLELLEILEILVGLVAVVGKGGAECGKPSWP